MSFKSILEFHNPAIDALVAEVARQKDLLSVVRRALPEMLAQHTLSCVIHNATLLIYTDSAVWSSQLRFYNSAIMAEIRPFISEPIKMVQIRLSER
ncbi:MAG: DciA family protein [Methylococcaceae bacterium]